MEADLFIVLDNIAFVERKRERLHLVEGLGKACEVAESRSNGFLIYDNTGSTERYLVVLQGGHEVRVKEANIKVLAQYSALPY